MLAELVVSWPLGGTGLIEESLFDPVAFVMHRIVTPIAAEVEDCRLVLDHAPRNVAELATAHTSYWADPWLAAKLAALL